MRGGFPPLWIVIFVWFVGLNAFARTRLWIWALGFYANDPERVDWVVRRWAALPYLALAVFLTASWLGSR